MFYQKQEKEMKGRRNRSPNRSVKINIKFSRNVNKIPFMVCVFIGVMCGWLCVQYIGEKTFSFAGVPSFRSAEGTY